MVNEDLHKEFYEGIHVQYMYVCIYIYMYMYIYVYNIYIAIIFYAFLFGNVTKISTQRRDKHF